MKRKSLSLSVVFNRANRLSSTGTGLVQLRATFDGQSRFFSTGIHIRPEQWDPRNRRVKDHPLASEFNRLFYGYLDRLQEQEIEIRKKLGFCPLDRLTLDDGAPTLSFLEFCQQELHRPDIGKVTFRCQKSCLAILESFRREIAFADLDLPFLRAFDRFLYARGLRVNSVDKHHRVLRRYINLAIKEGHIQPDKNPYRLFEMRTEEPDRVFLTREELRRLEEIRLEPGQIALRNARRLFLLACYTGLRFGDVAKLRYEHVIETDQGLELHFRMQKTKKNIVLPLHALFPHRDGGMTRPERLIRRAMEKTIPERPLFRLTNQYVNRQLKELAELAGIRKKLSFHVSRRTFGSFLATELPLHVVGELMGHAKITTTAIYTRLNGGMVRDELKKVNWRNG